MSVNSITNAAAARRTDIGGRDAPSNLPQIAAAAGTPPELASPGKKEASGVSTALNILFGYIPTEIVTMYVAVLGVLQPETPAVKAARAAGPVPVSPALWIAFYCFLVATPIFVWLVYAGKIKAMGKPLPFTWSELPIWEMTAALLAFAAWACALPSTPLSQFDWFSTGVASIAVIVVSTLLGLLAQLFQKPLNVDPT